MHSSGHRGGSRPQQGYPPSVSPPSQDPSRSHTPAAQGHNEPHTFKDLRRPPISQSTTVFRPQTQLQHGFASQPSPTPPLTSHATSGPGTPRLPPNKSSFGADVTAHTRPQSQPPTQNNSVKRRPGAQQDGRSQSLDDKGATAREGAVAPEPPISRPTTAAIATQGGELQNAAPQTRQTAAQKRPAPVKYSSHAVQPFQPKSANVGQAAGHTHDSRRLAQPHIDRPDNAEQHSDLAVSQTWQAEDEVGQQAWETEQRYYDGDQANVTYRVTEVYAPEQRGRERPESRYATQNHRAGYHQGQVQERQLPPMRHAEQRQSARSAQSTALLQLDHSQAATVSERFASGLASSPQIKNSTTGTHHRSQVPRAPAQSFARPLNRLGGQARVAPSTQYTALDSSDQATLDHAYHMQGLQAHHSLDPSRLRQGSASSWSPPRLGAEDPQVEEEIQDSGYQDGSGRVDHDMPPEMELDADGNVPGQEDEGFDDEVFAPPPSRPTAHASVKLEAAAKLEATANKTTGKKRPVPVESPAAPFKFAKNLSSVKHLMKMVDMDALQEKVLQQLESNESKGWELCKEMVTTHQDQSDFIQRQFHSYEQKLNAIKKVKDETFAEKKVITAKYEGAVDGAHEDMLTLTPGTPQYNQKRRLARRAGSVAPKRATDC